MQKPAPASSFLLAAALVFLGAILFSSKAVLVKLAYRHEIDSISLLALRFLFALPFYLAIAWRGGLRRSRAYRRPTRREWVQIALYGVAGYYLASLFDFIGLLYVTASLERILLFIYPTLVLLISALFLHRPITRTQYGALALTYAGIAVAFSENLFIEGDAAFLLGAGLIFLAALTYAGYLIGSGHLLPRLGTWQYTSLAMSAAAVAVLIHHAITNQLALFHFAPPVYGYAFLMAVIATVLPSFLISEGIRVIGAGNAAIIGSVGPISTIALAYIFLDERLGPLQWGGTVLVIAGVVWISLKREKVS